MQVSKFRLSLSVVRLTMGLITVMLISAAIIFELLPENQAKEFVIPVLVVALFTAVGQITFGRR